MKFVSRSILRVFKINSAKQPVNHFIFHFRYETSDQQIRQEVAELKNEGTKDEALSVQGFYSYIGPDGKNYSVGYMADETGFHPEGTHLPPAADVKRTPPVGIPPAALASLAGK